MNVSKPGWLKEYLEFKKGSFKDFNANKTKAAHPEQALYRIIQPTGILYGQASGLSDFPDSGKWSEHDKLKVLLTESLIGSSLLFYGKTVQDQAEWDSVVNQTIDSIDNFYIHVFPELSTYATTWFGKKKDRFELAERILEKRVERSSKQAANFWTHFFHNSLLFLDIYIFGEWIHTKGDQIVSDFFKYQRQELRFAVIKVITAGAHANRSVEYEERKLLDYFLQSANLTSEKKKEARELFEQGIEIEALDLPTNNSWILRKYFLETALLTVWADKLVEDVELEFLKRFAKHLHLHPDDLENSQLALESFILQHWAELEHLQASRSLDEVSEQFISRIAHVVLGNKERLIREARGNKPMLSLLKKARSGDLGLEEQLIVRDGILSMLKAIPSLSSISLPQRFLTLPILMKILPQDFFSEVLSN